MESFKPKEVKYSSRNGSGGRPIKINFQPGGKPGAKKFHIGIKGI